jgi:hypothetical protein
MKVKTWSVFLLAGVLPAIFSLVFIYGYGHNLAWCIPAVVVCTLIPFCVLWNKTTVIQEKSAIVIQNNINYTFETKTRVWNAWLEEVAPSNVYLLHNLCSYRKKTELIKIPCGNMVFHLILCTPENPESLIGINKIACALCRKGSSNGMLGFEGIAHYVAFEFVHRLENTFLEDKYYNPLERDQQDKFTELFIKHVRNFLFDLDLEEVGRFLMVGQGTHFEMVSQPHMWARVPR